MIYPHKKLIISALYFFFTILQNPYLSLFKGSKNRQKNINCIDMRRWIMLLTGSLIVILAACTKYEIPKPPCPEDLPTGVSYANDVQVIFDAKCVICHSGDQVPDLSPGWSYDELIDGEYVDTDFPCSSKIYEILTGSHADRIDEEEVITILGWIDEGAQDN
jgi:hypothetical protein